jgi:hypothetical protein
MWLLIALCVQWAIKEIIRIKKEKIKTAWSVMVYTFTFYYGFIQWNNYFTLLKKQIT